MGYFEKEHFIFRKEKELGADNGCHSNRALPIFHRPSFSGMDSLVTF